MKPRINYSSNWNNKLRLPIHTTIRLAGKVGHLRRDQEVDVCLNGQKLYEAVILDKQEMPFNKIPTPTLRLDTGYNYNGALHVFGRFYKGFMPTDTVALLAIQRISKPVSERAWHDLLVTEWNNDFSDEHLTKRLKRH